MSFADFSMQQHAAGVFADAMRRPSALQRLLDNQPQHVKDERQRLANLREARRQAAIDALRPRLTPDFLETLAQAARIMGEPDEFGGVAIDVQSLFGVANVLLPNMARIDFDSEDGQNIAPQ